MRFIERFWALLLGLGADVITVTSGTVGSAGNVAADLVNYLTAKLLEVAELTTIMSQFGEPIALPSNSSKTAQLVREEKFTPSTSPVQLTEGVPPDASGITLNEFTAVMEQYGYLVRLSDLAEITARHNVVERTIYLLGLHAAETHDILVFNVLDGGATTVYRPNSKTGDASLLASDQIGYSDLVELAATLQGNGARPFADGDYVFVCAPQVYASMLKDPDFKAAAQFRAPERIWKGEVQELADFRVVRTNSPAFSATSQSTSGYTNKVYSSFAIAQFAYQVVTLQNLRVYVVAPGGQSDPLQQSRKIGWKFAFKTVITNQSWLARVRSSGLDSSNV